MKISLLTLFMCICVSAFALYPQQKAPLYEHLLDVNAQWKYVEMEDAAFFEEVTFVNDIARIQAHLLMVEKVFLQRDKNDFSPEAYQNRIHLLKKLAIYREVGNFPKNLYHTVRRPYFIDEYGTACAVGHLLQVSGEQAFAQRVSEEMNVAYLLDMPYPEIENWADENGFTKQELALIQPGYQPQVSWSTLGNGADGEITAMLGDQTNQRLIIAGNFTQLDGVACNQVGIYENGSFSGLGNGVDGEIKDIEVFENNIYLAGDFANGSNIAVWDGQTWNYERFGEGIVHTLLLHDNLLLAGGDFKAGAAASDSLSYIAAKLNGSWTAFGASYGPVYALTHHQDRLYAGGNFFESTSSAYVKRMAQNGSSVYWEDATQPLEKLDNVVRTMVSDGTYLFAGGDCYDLTSNVTFCLARLGNSGWERLVNPTEYVDGKVSIKQLFYHEGNVLVAGDYQNQPLVGIYGRGLSKFRDYPNAPHLEPIAAVDSTVNTIASVNGNLFMGGTFSGTNFQPNSLKFLAQTPNLTSIDPDNFLSVDFYPNPMKTVARANLETTRPISNVEVFDLAGRAISITHAINGSEITLERGQLTSGMYFVKIYAESEIVGFEKLWVE